MPSDTATDLTPMSLEKRAQILEKSLHEQDREKKLDILLASLVPHTKINVNGTTCDYFGRANDENGDDLMLIRAEHGSREGFPLKYVDLLSLYVPEDNTSDEFFAYHNAFTDLEEARNRDVLFRAMLPTNKHQLEIPSEDTYVRKKKRHSVFLSFGLFLDPQKTFPFISNTTVFAQNQDLSINESFQELYVPALAHAATRSNMWMWENLSQKYKVHTTPRLSIVEKADEAARNSYSNHCQNNGENEALAGLEVRMPVTLRSTDFQ